MIPCIINTQKSTLKNEAFFFRNKPYKTPARNAVSVKPGKYAPTGNKNAEITSPIAATIPPATGPYKTAAITIGTKLNPIFKFHVCMEKRANIISAATSIPRIATDLTLNLLLMVFLLSSVARIILPIVNATARSQTTSINNSGMRTRYRKKLHYINLFVHMTTPRSYDT